MSDDRQTLLRRYRELGGGELLRLYRNPEELPAGASDLLRSELRLRGIDPETLEATVPKAVASTEEGEEPARSEMDPPEAIAIPPDVRRALDAASDATTGAHGLSASHAAARREQGSIAAATAGMIGIAALVFSSYATIEAGAGSTAAAIALLSGVLALGASLILYRRSRVSVR